MPLGNGFLGCDQFRNEYFFELGVAFCPSCCMVQLTEQPEREKMFNPNYAYFSSTSTSMAAHFEMFAQHVRADYLAMHDPFVVEIGSNDGIMLQHFARVGIRHLGIELSANVAQVAACKGIQTKCRFFDKDFALEIFADHGQADERLSPNRVGYIPHLPSFVVLTH